MPKESQKAMSNDLNESGVAPIILKVFRVTSLLYKSIVDVDAAVI